MPDVPFLCHYRRATELVDTYPYKEIAEFCHTHRDKVETVLTRFLISMASTSLPAKGEGGSRQHSWIKPAHLHLCSPHTTIGQVKKISRCIRITVTKAAEVINKLRK